MRPLLSVQHIVKRFGGVTALADGNLEVYAGEVVALMGANGSGKSTLSKIINGAVVPDSGTITLDGEVTRFASPKAARQRGIAAVYQELSLVPDMTVAENIWLAHEPRRFGQIRWREVFARTERLLDLFAGTIRPSLRPDTPVAALPPDERQIVEILKALSLEPRLMILDEATASLDSRQVSRVFELVADWKARGMAVVFISHRMEEVFRVADRATVLRSGRTVGTVSIAETSEQALVAMMIEGGAVERQLTHDGVGERPVRLVATDLRAGALRGVSLHVRDGELLGLGGLRGQGQSDLLLALFGAIPYSGEVMLGGRPVHFTHPRQAMRAGLAFVPGDRGREGLLHSRSILENLLLPSWERYGRPLQMARARADAAQVARDLRLVMGGLDDPVSSLSGGNAQKVVLGKWLLRQPQVLLLDDPTKGVDVGAKGEFYRILADLRAAGTAIILYSSDDEELLGLCDRVLVLHDGRVSAELAGEQLNRTALVTASMGTTHADAT
ncbi:MAG: sugar ABC transporter ATP-binding protein [Chloroflexota bacterium]